MLSDGEKGVIIISSACAGLEKTVQKADDYYQRVEEIERRLTALEERDRSPDKSVGS